ncbi:penicillin-binding transpeptidase domain-containing protein [Streptomyces otsuchiensis]|uniref:penicillin-binding transpeptidase domain-containing protein n=1 Tax=Streptomyces otsuchiensis TaxID=2681388 RepID=UPI001D131BAC|nr:penicillin-binding transpeptidase domain-containing protein [Streptomyces otsuchiensis]
MRRNQILLVAGAMAALGLIGGLVFWLTRGGSGDEARERADAFLASWPVEAVEEGDDNPAAAMTDDPEAAASLLASVNRNLAPEARVFEVVGESRATGDGDDREVTYTATYDLGAGLPEWSYEATLRLTPGGDDGWQVVFEPSAIHPELAEGQTLARSERQPERGAILAADGDELAAVGRVWNITVWPAQLEDADAAYEAVDALDVGIDIDALAERVDEAEPDQAVPVVTLRDSDYEEHRDELNAVPGLQFEEDSRPLAHYARSVVGGVDADSGEGGSGLQARYQEQLAGTPQTAVVIADRESGAAVETLVEGEGGGPGEAVLTTIDIDVQRAAEEALKGQDQDGSIAVVRPSTGEILALADQPAGFARSAEGQYAPGSGFKVVTTAALLENGTASGDVLGCPKYATVDGRQFHNQNEFELGPSTTLHEAFIRSCNTTFIENRDALSGGQLTAAAEAFGLGGEWDTGITAYSGSVPDPSGDTDMAASLIGQARVQASPLAMASVAATVAAGEFRQPVLVPDAVEEPHRPSGALSETTVEQLRTMMRDAVTEGTASALANAPGTPHAKTGTAEIADEDGELTTNAWLIGYQEENDLAFAVLLEDGGSGGSHAGPVAAALLEALG